MNSKNNASPKISVKNMTMIALMTAVICVLSPVYIPLPFSPVPITLASLAIFLAIYILGMKKAMLSYFLYLLIGIAGIPVFSGFSAGIVKFAGPTGGYLIGFIFMIVVSGFFIEKFPKKKMLCIIGMALGTLVCYVFGSVWLAIWSDITFLQACLIGVVPYLAGDAIKIAVAAGLGPKIRQAVATAINN